MEPSYSYTIIKHSAFLLIVSLLLQAYSSNCCLEKEKEALLQLKSYFISLSISSNYSFNREYVSDQLSSWDSNGEGSCCLWHRVACNNSTQHVTELSLSNIIGYGFENILNVTLFEPFGELISLNLSLNRITNLVGNGGNKRLSLRSLEILDFGRNSLRVEEVGDLVGSLTSLKKLNLGWNEMTGNFTGKEITHLEKLEVLDLSSNLLDGFSLGQEEVAHLDKLEVLDLSYNNLNGFLLGQAHLKKLRVLDLSYNSLNESLPGEVARLEKLEVLDLSYNNLNGFLLGQEVAHLKKLRVLDLSFNQFNGSLPEGLCKLRKLEDLSLASNNLSGDIPKCLSNMTSLLTLVLSYNSFSGNLPTLFNLPSLQTLLIHNNYFQGRFFLCHLMNHSRIEHLFLSNNALQVEIEDASCLSSKLASLGLAKCKLISQFNFFPKVLLNLSNLEVLDLSSNGLTGEIPSQLGELGMIQALNLSHNLLSGSIPRSFSKLKNIESLDLSSNNLSGAIPLDLVQLNFLAIFNVSYNNLSGEVPNTGQFGTFDERNYLGNPLLCGFQINKSSGIHEIELPTQGNPDEAEDEGFDTQVFLWSFGGSSITVFLAFVAVLAINPHEEFGLHLFDVKLLWWFHP